MAKLLTRLLRLSVVSGDGEQDQVATAADYAGWLNATTVRFFTREFNHSQSSRALGWTTNDQTVRKTVRLTRYLELS